jgi:HEAT repeat protein
MARELILKLSEDVGQLLVAGAHLAPSSQELAQDRDGLQKLAQQVGAKAPAIVKLAEAADKTVKASPGAVAGELMSLMQMAAQVRAAQAQVAPAEASAPLAPRPPVSTPCNAKDLYDLHTALIEKGQGRMEVIERHIEGGTIADLRLVEALVYAMGDSWIGEKITAEAIPKLGRAIVAPIRARLELKKGRSVDGRRLRALVAIEKENARELLQTAVAEGSAEIREAAMDAIADHVQGVAEFEKHALETIRKEKSGDVRRAAVRALAGSASDEALDVLLEAIDKPNTMAQAADALQQSKHPAAPKKLLEKLRAATAVKPKANQDLQPVTSLLRALQGHQLPEIATTALPLIADYGGPALFAALNSADRPQLARIADMINGNDSDLFEGATEAAFRLGEAEAYKRLAPLFKAKDRDKKVGRERLQWIASALGEETARITDKWRSLLVSLIDEVDVVIGLLGLVKEKRAVKPLINLVNEGKGDAVWTAVTALGEIGDRTALDCLLARLEKKGEARHWSLRSAILSLSDESTVDKVRTISAKRKDDAQSWMIHNLLRALETRFPGR